MGKKSRLKKLRREQDAEFFRNLQIPKDRVAGAFFHQGNRIILSKDILVNQLRRDAVAIAATFDKLCDSDLRIFSDFHATVVGILACGIARYSHDELRMKMGLLLNNAQNSFVASLYLLRGGFLLQPGIVLRTMLEQVSTAIHLCMQPSELTKIERGEFDSTKTIASAKKAIPIFGQLYGSFSEGFTHISELHLEINPMKPYEQRNPALDTNLIMAATALFVLSIAAELAFFDCTTKPLFFRKLKQGQYIFRISPEAQRFLDVIQKLTQRNYSVQAETVTKPSP